jgi:uncharacterized protein (TIGR02246 family)
MNKHPIILQLEKADRAIVAEDFDTLLDIYTEDAILMLQPGSHAKGKVAIRKAFEGIAQHFKNGLQVTQQGMEILQSGKTAMVLANNVISAPNLPSTVHKATYVFNQRADDVWLCSIDNSYGYEIIQNSTYPMA